jgi:hypothetical protein
MDIQFENVQEGVVTVTVTVTVTVGGGGGGVVSQNLRPLTLR